MIERDFCDMVISPTLLRCLCDGAVFMAFLNSLRLFLIVPLLLVGISFAAAAEVVKQGDIKGKRVKWTQGSVVITGSPGNYRIQLGNNFKTKQAPALFVYLGHAKPTVEIGALKALTGAQSYRLPADVDPNKFSRLFIYCKPYGIVFGSARLKKP